MINEKRGVKPVAMGFNEFYPVVYYNDLEVHKFNYRVAAEVFK